MRRGGGFVCDLAAAAAHAFSFWPTRQWMGDCSTCVVSRLVVWCPPRPLPRLVWVCRITSTWSKKAAPKFPCRIYIIHRSAFSNSPRFIAKSHDLSWAARARVRLFSGRRMILDTQRGVFAGRVVRRRQQASKHVARKDAWSWHSELWLKKLIIGRWKFTSLSNNRSQFVETRKGNDV